MGFDRGRIARFFRTWGRAPRRSPYVAWIVGGAKFTAVLLLLLYPWAGLGTAVSAVFCATINAVDAVVFPSMPEKMTYELGARAPEWRPRVVVRDAATGATVHYAVLQIRRVWYVPMAVFAALAIAWPLALRWSLAAWIAGGLAVLQAPAAAAVLVFAQRTGVVVASPGARAAVETVYRVLLAPSIQYALPAALWLFIHSLSEGWSWARDLLRARGH